jgi:alcohol dehydrogenase
MLFRNSISSGVRKMNLAFGKFGFTTGTKMRYGPGTHEEIGGILKELGAKKIFLVTDPNIVELEMTAKLTDLLGVDGAKVDIFDEVPTEPTDEHVRSGVALLKEKGSDVVVALGGGSVMDCAKMVNVMAENSGELSDYDGIPSQFPNASPRPLIAIPTTSGTGSETAGWAGITDTSRDVKMAFLSSLLEPNFAIVDPFLTLDLPPRPTAYSGIDALSQAIESMLHLRRSPIAIALGMHAVQLISKNLVRAFAHGYDLEARSNMSFGSLLAGYSKRLGGCIVNHSIANTVGSAYHLPHGLMVGVFLPHVLRDLLPSDTELLAQIAQAMGAVTSGVSERDAAEMVVVQVCQLLEDLEIPTLAELGVMEDAVPDLAKGSMEDAGIGGNPRPMTQQTCETIIRAALAETHDGRVG